MPAPNPVHAYLDALAPAFRRAAGVLAVEGETVAPLVAGLPPRCLVPVAQSPLPEVAEPLGFDLRDETPAALPPARLEVYGGGEADAETHLAAVVAHLVEWLGSGQPEDSGNTRGHRWRHGVAEVSATVWPRALNRHRRVRYRGRRESTEWVSVTIWPGLGAVSDEALLSRLTGLRALDQEAGPWRADLLRGHAAVAYVWPGHWPYAPASGAYVTADREALVLVADGEFAYVPRADWRGLREGYSPPERGPGFGFVDLFYAVRGLGGETERTLPLLAYLSPAETPARAAALRRGLGLA